jgi:hypothetical protein
MLHLSVSPEFHTADRGNHVPITVASTAQTQRRREQTLLPRRPGASAVKSKDVTSGANMPMLLAR